MKKYLKTILLILSIICSGVAGYITCVSIANPYRVRNAIIDKSERYIAGVASKYHWKDYKLFIYDIQTKAIKARTLKFERDWYTYPYTLIGLHSKPAFSEDSSSVYWVHETTQSSRTQYNETHEFIKWNFDQDEFIQKHIKDKRPTFFRIIPPLEKLAWYDLHTIHTDHFKSGRSENFMPFKQELKGMNISPDGRLLATWGKDDISGKLGAKQLMKIWRIGEDMSEQIQVLTLDDFLEDFTRIHIQFSNNNKIMHVFANQIFDQLQRDKYEPLKCQSQQFDTQNWTQLNKYVHDDESANLQSSIVSSDGKRLLLSGYTDYPRWAVREIAYENKGGSIKEYFVVERGDQHDIPGVFYGKDNLIHLVTSNNRITNIDRGTQQTEVNRLALNNDISFSLISFIFMAGLSLSGFLNASKTNQYKFEPGVFAGFIAIYVIALAIIVLALRFAAITSEYFWLHFWPIFGFLIITHFMFRRHLKIKLFSWILALALLLIATVFLFHGLASISV
jgi:hypothetical protein